MAVNVLTLEGQRILSPRRCLANFMMCSVTSSFIQLGKYVT